MTVKDLLKMGFIDDETKVTVFGETTKTKGNWFHDFILDRMNETVDWFGMDLSGNELRIRTAE